MSFLAVLICFSLQMEKVNAEMPPPYREESFGLSLDNQYYWSKENYDVDGQAQVLNGSNQYHNLTTQVNGVYAFDSNWRWFGGIDFSYAESENASTLRSDSQVTALQSKIQYLFSGGAIRWIPEISARLSLTDIEDDTDKVLLDEGVQTYTGGSWLGVSTSLIKFYGYLGYSLRGDGRSDLMPFELGVSKNFSHYIFSLGLKGARSVKDDVDTDNRLPRAVVTSRVNAGSLHYYSVNPNWTNAEIKMEYSSSPNMSVYGGYAQSLSGENYSKGQTGMIGFLFYFDAGAEQQKSQSQNRKSKNRKNVEFDPTVEVDYDDRLFTPDDEE